MWKCICKGAKLDTSKHLFGMCIISGWKKSRPKRLRKKLIFPSLGHVRLFATPWTIAYQAPLSMGFSRQEYWSGLPFPSPGVGRSLGLQETRGWNLGLLHCRQTLYRLSHQGSPSVQFSSFAQSCPTLCDPMNRSTPGLPVHHQLPEFTQIHVHRVSDAIQSSHPLLFPSPPAPYPSQHQSLFQFSQLFAWGGQSTGVSALASFLPQKSQGWSPSEWTGWISLQSKEFSALKLLLKI